MISGRLHPNAINPFSSCTPLKIKFLMNWLDKETPLWMWAIGMAIVSIMVFVICWLLFKTTQ